jgi:hypothetical protein
MTLIADHDRVYLCLLIMRDSKKGKNANDEILKYKRERSLFSSKEF